MNPIQPIRSALLVFASGLLGGLMAIGMLIFAPAPDNTRPVIPEGFVPVRPGYVSLHRDTFIEIRDAARADGYRAALVAVQSLLGGLPHDVLTNRIALAATVDFELWPEGVGK